MENLIAIDIYNLVTTKIRDDNILVQNSNYNNKLFNLIKKNIKIKN